MSVPIIEVSGLSKHYRLGSISAGTFAETLSRGWQRLRGRTPPGDDRDFWALKDVSFSVQPGEVVGIIGRNGAGKSTLLKILSRITEPTSGRAVMRGRVASLLEVGTGFHPDLSGRDNIYLNGAILGMNRAEVRAKFDEIVAFAEVDKFIDTPVKRYSSGMYVRLAFAVAAHMEPDILVIDEVLAVGDAAFQKKCLGKMNEVSRQAGRTVLFVSHNMGVVANLCANAVLLENGRVRTVGPASTVVGDYIKSKIEFSGIASWSEHDSLTGNDRLRLHSAKVFCNGEVTADVRIDSPVVVEYEFEVIGRAQNTTSSIHLYDKQGVWVLCSGPNSQVLNPGMYSHAFTIPAHFLNDGTYTVSIVLLTEVSQIQVFKTEAISFFVHETGAGREEYGGIISGCVRPRLEWTTSAR